MKTEGRGPGGFEQAATPQRIRWDAARFNETLVRLAQHEGTRLPAHLRPDFIDLSSWKEFCERLWADTVRTQNEHSRPVLADTGLEKIFMGKATEGGARGVLISRDSMPSRAQSQKVVGTIHTHPIAPENISNLFSHQDYFLFLWHKTEQVMLVLYGERDGLLVMKTNQTPEATEPSDPPHVQQEKALKLKARIDTVLAECLAESKGDMHAALKKANRLLCIEFQLVLYRLRPKTPEDGDDPEFYFRRLKVAA